MSPIRLSSSADLSRQISHEDDLSELPESPEDIPEEPDLMILADDARQISIPPAHLAARFYRSNKTRRKSSAASSRRNSLSSHNSHPSNGKYRSSIHSHHVAQHLRRASILEDRKARLADRAAHAEQVRMRAALAKATPKVSNCEERALAAHQAREKYIAQVAASCAEEVRRAKKVAEEMKEKKAAEERRFRLELEEKHSEAERRRLEYKKSMLRRPRTASLQASDAKKPTEASLRQLDQNTAAKKIQQAWRTRQRRTVVEDYRALAISIDSLSNASFEETGERLSEEKVIVSTVKVLNLFGLLREDRSPTHDRITARKFLSAFLILGHPTSVLSQSGPQEQDLINKSKDLVISFEDALFRLCQGNNHRPSRTAMETLSQAQATYISTFDAWKTQDASTLIETMVMSFVELDSIWQSVKDETSDEVANDYRQGIRDNQAILLSKIRKLAGPERANILIKKAIRESRRSRVRARPIGDVRPRTALRADTAPDPSSSAPNLSSDSDSQFSRDARRPPLNVPTQRLSQLFSAMPDNRVLVHELAIDKDYRLKASPHADVRDSFNMKACDSMRKGIQEGRGSEWIAAMAENIGTKLLRLLKPASSLHVMISEALDADHIYQQSSRGTFSYERFFSFMSDILPKLCAPFRDAEVKTLCQELAGDDDAIDKTFKLLRVIDNMSLDYSNFLLTNAAPTLIREGPGYEERSFNKDLESGVVTLEGTKRWWMSASINVITEASRASDSAATSRPPSTRIYAQGLVDLAIATSPVREDDIPETLILDKNRFARMRTETLRIITIGAILLTAKNLLKRDVRGPWKAEAARIWDTLKDADTATSPLSVPDSLPTSSTDQAMNDLSSRILSIIASSFNLPPTTRNILLSHITRFAHQASTGRLTDPVLKVLFNKLKAHFLTRLAAVSSAERVRAAREASESLANSGLGEFSGRVADMVEELGRVAIVDKAAHGVFYERVTMEIEELGRSEEGVRREGQ